MITPGKIDQKKKKKIIPWDNVRETYLRTMPNFLVKRGIY